MKRYTYFLFATFILGLYSCIKKVDEKNLPHPGKKLVIGCFISPQDTILKVTVSKSNPLFTEVHTNGNNVEIKDAQVSLSDGSTKVNLLYESDSSNKYSNYNNASVYIADISLLPIQPGKTYYLTVSTPDGLSASASCTIPATVNNTLSLNVDSTNKFSGKGITINFQWTDIANETNYYVVTVKEETTYSNLPIYFSNSYEEEIFTDKNRDGQRFSARTEEVYIPHYYNSNFNSFDCYLLSTDEHYYKFQNSLNSYDGENPFSEPTLIYSNVNGGLGIFAGYQRFKKSILLY